ncbi:uncharacterized protein YoxC [Bacillus ectoiniformans]|uniref:hypothetical protein n=1 Tax=Bacillus ectoiniformans TaxID=1494429 RepID=UPI00195BA9EF|nr:hypothetical protein [Bacillus ectoiniformans]MBM7649611.1 uncharacterized protein YoxC [Bacillus ectoiniformans]
MEIIGWLSLAIIIGALIYLGISAFGTYKSMKPKIDHLQATSERMQEQQTRIQAEADQLKVHQTKITGTVEQQKENVMFTVEEAKKTPERVKQLGVVLKSITEEYQFKLPAPRKRKKADMQP